ncbi:MAG TPA: MerR family transcriptional regulator [bacterium]|nr:MerR family transcriptional regulator [bacterium]HQG47114.1 MerR family transcriptional regulator [bacterium]HQI47948.1 MerR family transcriptional regulator [bacterium]HQJ64625.1 MerR family transcriptional regulator [bacterium]
MENNLYDQQEFLQKTGLSPEDLAQWEKNHLLHSEVRIDNNLPGYTEEHLRAAQQIQNLVQIGYSLPEIRKILKKVGLPNRGENGNGRLAAEYLTVGELAEQAQVNNRTIKYWEERGIITPDRRTSGGFRLYAKHWVQICQLILDLQNFGYTLEQIKEQADLYRFLLELEADKSHSHNPQAALGALEEMERQMQALFARMKLLREGIERWEAMLKKRRKELAQLKNEYARPGA